MIALDIETSGLDPERTSILSIGALDTNNPLDQFYGECQVWNGAEITDEALAVNGFTREQAADTSQKSEAELIQKFVAWVTEVSEEGLVRNTTIVGQNSSFDRDFARAACRRAGVKFPFSHRTIDTHSLVWLHMIQKGIVPPIKYGSSSLSLTAALQYCGLPEELKPHNALNGAFAHAEVFSRIAYNKKMLEIYSSFEIPWYA
jgi:DNA polymerase III epsilon subunit-like protein